MTFEQILGLKELNQAQVVAGQNGLFREITWSHVLYTAEISDWMEAGYLVITNGAGFTYPEKDILSILDQIIEIQGAGIIIERGKFINEISPKVRKRADELEIPIIEVRNKLDTSALTRAIGELFFQSGLARSKKQQLKELIYLSDIEDNLDEWKNLGYEDTVKYVVIAIQITHINQQKENSYYYSVHLEKQFLQSIKQKFFCEEQSVMHFEEQGIFYYFIPLSEKNCESKKQYEICENIHREINQAEQDLTLCIGISNVAADHKGMRVSVNQAQYALQSLQLCHKENDVRLYENMGIYRIFFQYDNNTALYNLYNRILGSLEEQDRESKGEWMETLEAYFRCNCNLSKTADELFIHRNTLKYRLKKMSEIIGMDFDNYNERFTILFALKIRKYMNVQDVLWTCTGDRKRR